MARPLSVGLDYFPLDTNIDQDDKIAIIEAQHGMLGFGIIIKLFMKIYSEGYFYDWTEKEQILFAKRINVDINQVNVIINDCIKWKLFDETLFNKYKILTSRGIQIRYIEAAKRRQKVELIKEYLLLNDEQISVYNNIDTISINADVNKQTDKVNVDINTDINKVTVNTMLHDVNINSQSKVKESKVKKSKVNKEGTSTTPSRAPAFNPLLILDSPLCEEIPPEIKNTLKCWLRFKAEKRQSYKETGFKKLLKQTMEALETNSEKEVIGVFEHSMNSNYSGVFFDRLPKHSTAEPPKSEVKYGRVI